MDTRKVVTLVVFVSLCFVLALVTPAWPTDASARPHSHGSSTLAVQSARSESNTLTGLPAYDSGWESLGIRPDPISVQFTHNLGGHTDNYRVSLECRDDTSLGTYGCADLGFNANALWYGLADSTTKVYATGGSRPDDVRVRIWRANTVYLPIVVRNFRAP